MFSSAVVAGRLHEKTGIPCQDVVAGRREGGVVALALADGAGSAAMAELGAQLAAVVTLELLTTEFDFLYEEELGIVQTKIIGSILARIDQAAEAASVASSEFASTLLFVAVKQNRFLVGHIGDGIIACERAGKCEVLSRPQRGEHVNETIFVTSAGAASRLVVERGILGGLSAFAIMSDGAAESLYLRSTETVAPALASMWFWQDSHSPKVVDFALEANLRDQIRLSTGDDCSLALLRRVGVPLNVITSMDTAFQRSFLDCRSQRGLKNRLAVLFALQAIDVDVSVATIAASTQLSANTVRKHVRFLRDLLD